MPPLLLFRNFLAVNVSIMILGAGCASPQKQFETQANEFQKTALTQKPDDNKNIADIDRIILFNKTLRKALAALEAEGIQNTIYEDVHRHPIIEISRSNASPLNRAAVDAWNEDGVKFVYDLNTLFTKPWAEATFNGADETIVLAHHMIIHPDPHEDVLEHELIHAKIWKEIKNKIPSPYAALMTGDPFKPAMKLNLDEMKAYHHDLKKKIKRLKDFLAHAPNFSDLVKNSRLKEIIQNDLDEKEQKFENKNELEELVTDLSKTLKFEKWHTEPPFLYLPTFIARINELKLREGKNEGQPILFCETISIDQDKVGLGFYQTQTPFGKDEFLSHPKWILRVATQHEAILKKTESELRAILSAQTPAIEAKALSAISTPAEVHIEPNQD